MFVFRYQRSGVSDVKTRLFRDGLMSLGRRLSASKLRTIIYSELPLVCGFPTLTRSSSLGCVIITVDAPTIGGEACEEVTYFF